MKDFEFVTHTNATCYDQWGNPTVVRVQVSRRSQHTTFSENSQRLKSRLKLTPHPFLRDWDSRSTTIGHYFPNYGGRDIIRCDGASWFNLEKVKSNAADRAVRKFYSEVGGIRSNLADIYRTRVETMNMIGDRLKSVARAALAVRRGDFKKASRALGIPQYAPRSNKRKFSSDWLELAYGWTPLLSDIHELAAGFPDIKCQVKVRGHASDTIDLVQNGQASYYRAWEKWNGTIRSTCCISSNVHMTGTAVKAAADLGLTNPAAVAWEAVPWSFVVDWVLPIGDYLESFSSLSGLTFSDMNFTYTSHQVTSDSYLFNTAYGRGNAPSGVTNLKRKERRLGSLPSYPLPSFKNPVSSSHLANAFALFRTNVK